MKSDLRTEATVDEVPHGGRSGRTAAATKGVPFFITGLPRSRTAWLAAWLSTPGALCVHDVPVLRGAPGVAGYSGSELLLDVEWLSGEYPEAKWLVVTRNADDVERSLRRWAGSAVPRGVDLRVFLAMRDREMPVAAARQFGGADGFMAIAFEELSDINAARRIWEFLKPGIAFEAKRFFMFEQLNIQQRKPSWLWQL